MGIIFQTFHTRQIQFQTLALTPIAIGSGNPVKLAL